MRKLIAAVMLAAATPAFADPLVNCIAGCPEKGAKLKADTQIKDAWWFGPSLGLALAARDNATGVWESNISFLFQYGIKWRPTWWTATSTFLSLDLGFQAGTTNVTAPDFQVTLAPTLNILSLLAIGYGPRFHFNGPVSTSGVLFLGLATSFGGP